MERAFAEASRLPEPEQEALGSWLLEELSSERQWMKTFPESTDVLERLADEALAEHREGRTRSLAPETL